MLQFLIFFLKLCKRVSFFRRKRKEVTHVMPILLDFLDNGLDLRYLEEKYQVTFVNCREIFNGNNRCTLNFLEPFERIYIFPSSYAVDAQTASKNFCMLNC